MRLRLSGLILTLMITLLVALGVPLGRAIDNSYTGSLFLDRLNDTARFAALAEQADTVDQLDSVQTELDRYHWLYGIDCYLLADDGVTVRLRAATTPSLIRSPSAVARISSALGGRRSEQPDPLWPWSSRPLVVAEPIVRGGDVVGAMVTVSSTARMRAKVWRAWLVVAALELLCLAACVYLADRLARWALHPVGILDAAANEVATGRLGARVNAGSGPAELRRLAITFNSMADHVQLALERQEAFVADASHQLRNPLAALMIRMEDVAGRVSADLRSDAALALAEAHRLVDILDRLLLLARSDHADVHRRACDVADVVRRRILTWEPIAAARGIQLRYPTVRPVIAWADETAIADVLDVVLDNAQKFSPNGAPVDVATSKDRDGTVRIVVRDFGPGLTADELNRIGGRFWRGSTRQNVAGYGLGLSIARALLSRMDATLQFSTPSGGGLQVEVVLPAADGFGTAAPAQSF